MEPSLEPRTDTPAISPPQVTPPRTGRVGRIFPFAAAVLAFAVVICAYSPRFISWPNVNLPPSKLHTPETIRAVETLRQLQDPFVKVTTPENRVIKWRLLFPVVAHYLRFSREAFLALPPLGCFLVLWWTAARFSRASSDRAITWLSTALAGTASWFLVSTGWLGYFDSWYILGLLLATFSTSRTVLVLTCLLTPWVDERFVLTLPLCLVVRALAPGEGESDRRKHWVRDASICFAVSAIYVAVRLGSMAMEPSDTSMTHLRDHLRTHRVAQHMINGLWYGFRALWVFVAVSVWLAVARKGLIRGAAYLVVLVATLVVNLALAFDVSRSVSVLMPAVILGMLFLVERPPARARWIFGALLLANLLSPAAHVIAGYREPMPIQSVVYELGLVLAPPREVANFYIARGRFLASHDKPDLAIREYESAIRIDPKAVTAYVERGTCLLDLGRPEEAHVSFDTAIRADPAMPEPYYFRALLDMRSGNTSAVLRDLKTGLSLCRPGASFRLELERMIRKLEASASQKPGPEPANPRPTNP